MSKAIQALLSGMLMTFILDFFLFLGIKINYIDAYDIDLYYNILFADNQNIFIYLFFSAVLGYLLIYFSGKVAVALFGFMSIIVLATLYAPVGKNVGEMLLMQKDIALQTKRFSYHGDLLYDGRDRVSFYDYRLKKVLHIEKNRIKGEY